MISLQFDKTQPLKGYRGVSLRAEDRDAPIAISLLVRMDSSKSPPFILLRETLDASIYLGSIVDRAGHPKAWVEIWVQNVDRVAFSFRAQLEPLTNSVLDRRWADRAAMFRTLKRATIIETGAEFNHPVPALIDGKEGMVIHPSDPVTRRPFLLCQDEKALEIAGLPSYGSSLHRYLWNGPGADEPVFMAITSGAPMPPGVRPVNDIFKGLYPFNPGGGLLLVRPLARMGFSTNPQDDRMLRTPALLLLSLAAVVLLSGSHGPSPNAGAEVTTTTAAGSSFVRSPEKTAFSSASTSLAAANNTLARALASNTGNSVSGIAQAVTPYTTALTTFNYQLHQVAWSPNVQIQIETLERKTQALIKYLSTISSVTSTTSNAWLTYLRTLGTAGQSADNAVGAIVGVAKTNQFPNTL